MSSDRPLFRAGNRHTVSVKFQALWSDKRSTRLRGEAVAK